ncbi:hypothetical protein GCM10028804_33510 [Larkinella terrae]
MITSGCRHSVPPEENDPGDLNYTNELSLTQQWFNGKWKLTSVTAMNPTLTVPNVQLVVGNNQIIVIRDEKQTDRVSFELSKIRSGFQLTTDAQPGEDNWYVRNPSLQVSSNRLLLQTAGSESSTFRFKRME